MLTATQYKNLPHSFKKVVDIDRILPGILADKVLDFFSTSKIVQERKYQRRQCEIACLPASNPRKSGTAG